MTGKKPRKTNPFKDFVNARQIQVYTTYSEITGRKYDISRLPAMVRGLPFVAVLSTLSQLTSLDPNDPEVTRSFSRALASAGTSPEAMQTGRRNLYSFQGILAAWKWMLAYGEPGNPSDHTSVETALNAAVLLILIVSDLLQEQEIPKDIPIGYALIRNAVFNSSQSISLMIGRAYLVYIKLAGQSDLFNKKEYLDIDADFRAKYGYNLTTYLAGLFALYSQLTVSHSAIRSDWGIDPAKILSPTPLKDVSRGLILPLSFDLAEGRPWALRELDSPWDFSLIQEKPFFLVSETHAIPVSMGHLNYQFFAEVFYRLRRCYPEKDGSFLTFMGRAFETYVSHLTVESLRGLPQYTVIPEFRYGPGRSKRSPDVMIRMGDNLLAIEAKSRSMTRESYTQGNPYAVDKDLRSLVVAPLSQLHARIKELRDLGDPSVQGAHNIYLMAVTLGGFPTVPPFEVRIADALAGIFSFKVKSWFHLDIQEFEFLMSLVSMKAPLPLFEILDRKAARASHLDFLNYSLAAGLPRDVPQYLKQGIDEFLELATGILVPKDS